MFFNESSYITGNNKEVKAFFGWMDGWKEEDPDCTFPRLHPGKFYGKTGRMACTWKGRSWERRVAI
jgi:hypothetical protein